MIGGIYFAGAPLEESGLSDNAVLALTWARTPLLGLMWRQAQNVRRLAVAVFVRDIQAVLFHPLVIVAAKQHHADLAARLTAPVLATVDHASGGASFARPHPGFVRRVIHAPVVGLVHRPGSLP